MIFYGLPKICKTNSGPLKFSRDKFKIQTKSFIQTNLFKLLRERGHVAFVELADVAKNRTLLHLQIRTLAPTVFVNLKSMR